jgi:hypothetical protein
MLDGRKLHITSGTNDQYFASAYRTYSVNTDNILMWICVVYCVVGSRDSVVGIATNYGLNDRGVGVRAPVG